MADVSNRKLKVGKLLVELVSLVVFFCYSSGFEHAI